MYIKYNYCEIVRFGPVWRRLKTSADINRHLTVDIDPLTLVIYSQPQYSGQVIYLVLFESTSGELVGIIILVFFDLFLIRRHTSLLA